MFKFDFEELRYEVLPEIPKLWKNKPGRGGPVVSGPFYNVFGEYQKTVIGDPPEFEFLNFSVTWRHLGFDIGPDLNFRNQITGLRVFTEIGSKAPSQEIIVNAGQHTGPQQPNRRNFLKLLRISVSEPPGSGFEKVTGFIDSSSGVQNYLLSLK